MKTKHYGYWIPLILVGLLTITISCSSEGSTDMPPSDMDGDGVGQIIEPDGHITEDDFENLAVELGMLVNTRNIAKNW